MIVNPSLQTFLWANVTFDIPCSANSWLNAECTYPQRGVVHDKAIQ